MRRRRYATWMLTRRVGRSRQTTRSEDWRLRCNDCAPIAGAASLFKTPDENECDRGGGAAVLSKPCLSRGSARERRGSQRARSPGLHEQPHHPWVLRGKKFLPSPGDSIAHRRPDVQGRASDWCAVAGMDRESVARLVQRTSSLARPVFCVAIGSGYRSPQPRVVQP